MSEKEILELENLSHLEQLDHLLQKRIATLAEPIMERQNAFEKNQEKLSKIFGGLVLLACAVIGTIFIWERELAREITTKADSKDMKEQFDRVDKSYLGRWDYYRTEQYEHEKLKTAFTYPDQAAALLFEINEHIISELGLKYNATRGVLKHE